MVNNELTFFDFCAGIGGGRVAAEQNGLRCVGFSEIDAKAEYNYRVLHHTAEKNFGDLTTLNIGELPYFDVMLAGFPCQTFSINGKRKGFADDRGKVIFSIADILRQKQIPYFILENVKGLVNHNNGNTLKEIISLLSEVGYNVTYKVLNSLDFGSIQSRERVYIVGTKDSKHVEYRFPDGAEKIEHILDVQSKEEEFHVSDTFIKYLSNKYNLGKYKVDDLLAMDGKFIDTRQSDIRIYDFCPTLRASRHGVLYNVGGKLYKLTPSECMMAQGFNKEHSEAVKLLCRSDVYKQAGNAMNVSTMRQIIKSLVEVI